MKQVRIFGGDFVRVISKSTEDARDVARTLAKTEAFEQSCRNRKRVEMLFAHLEQILQLDRLRLRRPRGAQFEFTLAAIARRHRENKTEAYRDRPAVMLSKWNGDAVMTVGYDAKRWAAAPFSPTASSGRVRRKRCMPIRFSQGKA